MNVLLLVEHDNQEIQTSSLHALTAAQVLSDTVTVFLVGYQCENVVAQCQFLPGVKQVLSVDAAHYKRNLAENTAAVIAEHAKDFTHILMASTAWGKNVLPRVAALLDVTQQSDIINIISRDTFVRPIYAGKALATVRSLENVKVLSVRATAFAKAEFRSVAEATTQALTSLPARKDIHYIETELSQSKRPDLADAKIVVSGGRGLQSAEKFKLIEQLADKLGAALGASRAAVDAAYVSNDLQVGQTGKIVAPELYIAIGISGAIQHIAGISDSKIIVAINKDPDAPIFQVADYGLLGDLFDIVPRFIEALDSIG